MQLMKSPGAKQSRSKTTIMLSHYQLYLYTLRFVQRFKLTLRTSVY